MWNRTCRVGMYMYVFTENSGGPACCLSGLVTFGIGVCTVEYLPCE